MTRGGNRRTPAAATAGYQTRLRKCPSVTGPPSGAVNTRESRERPAISTSGMFSRLTRPMMAAAMRRANNGDLRRLKAALESGRA